MQYTKLMPYDTVLYTPDGDVETPPKEIDVNDETKWPESVKTLVANARKVERDARRERDAAVKERDAHKTALDEKEASVKTEAQKLVERLDKLEEENKQLKQQQRDATVRSTVTEEAKKQNAAYPDDVYALIVGDLSYDNDGKPTNVDDLIKGLKQSRPLLFGDRATQINAINGRNTETPQDMNSLIRHAAGR